MTNYAIAVFEDNHYALNHLASGISPASLSSKLVDDFSEAPRDVHKAIELFTSRRTVEPAAMSTGSLFEVVDIAAEWLFVHDGTQWLCAPLTGVPPFWGAHFRSLRCCSDYSEEIFT